MWCDVQDLSIYVGLGNVLIYLVEFVGFDVFVEYFDLFLVDIFDVDFLVCVGFQCYLVVEVIVGDELDCDFLEMWVVDCVGVQVVDCCLID